MQYVIWGAGTKGSLALDFLPFNDVIAFIDSNPKLVHNSYREKPIISFEDYLTNYRDAIIVISPNDYEPIVHKLNELEIANFVLLDNIIY